VTPAELEAAARAWRDADPDPVTRAEVDRLLDEHDDAGLADRFGGRLTFGTAGLRGPLGAGPNRMNRVVVAQTSAGLGRFLAGREEGPTAVIGFDGRHNSAVFARDAAEVLAGAGVAVTLLPRALPTPVLAFAVRDLGASAGVMITASHNPAPDNGYKLYLGGVDAGSQLVPPADAEVLAAIEAVVAEGGILRGAGAVTVADESLIERYVAATARIAGAARTAPLTWVHTALHGVGHETVQRVVRAAGLPEPVVVAEQRDPDPDFPTVPFPNPEEAGALDLALAAAVRSGADLVVANDPDADRLALAVPEAGSWRTLTGNEVGLLLGWAAALRAGPTGGTFATSIVSTPGLSRIAAHFGFGYAETLTGFKWISRAPGLRYGFEEALGYLVDPSVVRDKDGISAAVAVLVEALALRTEDRTLLDRLAEIDQAIGAFVSSQVSLRVDDLAEIGRRTDALRAEPPRAIGGVPVLQAEDLSAGGALPPADVLRYRLEDARVIVRPSGTEPKLKVYLDAWSDTGSLDERRAAAHERLQAIEAGVRRLLA
jgi:phosphomannomutase